MIPLRVWFDIAIFLCGAVAALGVLGLAMEMRRKMPVPARRARSGKERGVHGTHLTKANSAKTKAGDAHAR